MYFFTSFSTFSPPNPPYPELCLRLERVSKFDAIRSNLINLMTWAIRNWMGDLRR
jgi:hypothetical protein